MAMAQAMAQAMIAAMSMQQLLACRSYLRLWWARLAGVSASQMLLVAIGCRCTT